MCIRDSTYPKRWIIVFGNSMDTSFVYITIVLGQPAGWSKEARLYAALFGQNLMC